MDGSNISKIQFSGMNTIYEFMIDPQNNGIAIGPTAQGLAMVCFDSTGKVTTSNLIKDANGSSLSTNHFTGYPTLVQSNSNSKYLLFYRDYNYTTHNSSISVSILEKDCSNSTSRQLSKRPTDEWVDARTDDHGNAVVVFEEYDLNYSSKSIEILTLNSEGELLNTLSYPSPYGTYSFAVHIAVHPTENWAIVTQQSHSGSYVRFTKVNYLEENPSVSPTIWNSSAVSGFTASGGSWYDSHYIAMDAQGNFVIVNATWSNSSPTNGNINAEFFNSSLARVSSTVLGKVNETGSNFDNFRFAKIRPMIKNGLMYLPWMQSTSPYYSYSDRLTPVTMNGSTSTPITFNTNNAHTIRQASDGAAWLLSNNKSTLERKTSF
jgi:hypothetical protein